MELNPTSYKRDIEKESKRKFGVPKPSLPKTENPKSEHMTFVLVGGGLADTLIKSEGMSTEIDEETGNLRRIRYIPGAMTIYVDEQKGMDMTGIVMSPIILEEGKKRTNDPLLQKYLMALNYNEVNGGKIYKLLDLAGDATIERESNSIAIEAQYMADKGIPIDKLRAVTRALGLSNVTYLKPDQVRVWATKWAKASPQQFMEMVESPYPEVIDAVAKALELGIIKFINNNREVAWQGAGTFLTIPMGYEEKRIEYVADYMLSSEGAGTLATLDKLISPQAATPTVQSETPLKDSYEEQNKEDIEAEIRAELKAELKAEMEEELEANKEVEKEPEVVIASSPTTTGSSDNSESPKIKETKEPLTPAQKRANTIAKNKANKPKANNTKAKK